jgi:hypothetical protein
MSEEQGTGPPCREDVVAFFRIMADQVKSLQDRLDDSVHRLKNVPKDELQDFIERERRLLEEWSLERLEEFSVLQR